MIYKLKILNKKNFLYAVFKILYKFFKFNFFYSLMVIFYPKNNNLMSKINFFNKNINLKNKKKLKIKGTNILELGGGNLFGLFPYFIKKKCKSFTNLDPFIENNPSKFSITRFFFKKKINKFFIFKDKHFKNYKQEKEIQKIKDRFDIIVSLSCLEHIESLEKTFSNLKFLTKKKHNQFHIINFSNHIDKNYPFKDLYELHPNDFKKKYNNNINFLRISDYEKLLKKKKFIYKKKILDTSPILNIRLHPYWKKYSTNELKIRTVLLTISARK
tara:strand:+ start:1180 stop:1995 length:816 start_codon:yes stop_codon:yes gene_type:complete